MSVPGNRSGMVDWFDREQTLQLVPPRQAVEAIESRLDDGFDPAADPARVQTKLRHGEFLLMPSEIGSRAGVKVATVAPGNPDLGLPRIQAIYMLYDSATLTPIALFDGSALTEIRTPAVSLAAIRGPLSRRGRELELLVFGAGPQAVAHVQTLTAVTAPSQRLAKVTFVTRRSGPLPWTHQSTTVHRVLAGSAEADLALATANVVVCATSSRRPVFDSRMLSDDAIVMAVGSHEPEARELDGELMGRSVVIVEDTATALRECGDVILACREGALDPQALLPMANVRASRLSDHRPIVFKGSGMSWQDLAIADVAFRNSAVPV
jgi:ornithine cyclodeaminase/alanine dehydrogenase-like protein (mu-crystallin family)